MRKTDHLLQGLAILLSIAVPVSLLASFKLTGILNQPEIRLEDATLEPMTLNLTRPSETWEAIQIMKATQKWQREGAYISASIIPSSYREGSAGDPFCGRDGLVFRFFVNVSFTQGCISSLSINLHLANDSSLLLLDLNPYALEIVNGSIVGISYLGTNETDAHLKANILNRSCSIRDQVFWVFLDENSQSHELQVTAEVVHVNGNSVEKIRIPMILKMLS